MAYLVQIALTGNSKLELLERLKDVAPGDRRDLLTSELAECDLNSIYIAPAMREYVVGERPRPIEVSDAG